MSVAVARTGLPDFPWDRLEPAKAVARSHPGGMVDLSVGTPVDPVPAVVRAALAAASDSPGYPLTTGTPALRDALTTWVRSACGAAPGFGVLPSIGSKELVAWLPTLLGLGPGDIVVIPSVCYPTYEVGAILAGATVVRSDSLLGVGPSSRVRLVWINSPGNPNGRVFPLSSEEFDYSGFFASLRKSGYKGNISVEAKPAHDFDTDAPETIAFLRHAAAEGVKPASNPPPAHAAAPTPPAATAAAPGAAPKLVPAGGAAPAAPASAAK